MRHALDEVEFAFVRRFAVFDRSFSKVGRRWSSVNKIDINTYRIGVFFSSALRIHFACTPLLRGSIKTELIL
ncbi:MAG: hypothetical protein U9Q88_16880, partial [Bacillota bacterium]|nr:hypothetical protein [Bacillota bacterium]